MNDIPVDDWKNCYPSNWNGLLIERNHPAKFSSKLIDRIFDHLKRDRVFDGPGIVVDPFAGIASGALSANRRGIDWIGVEIEPDNAEQGRHNIEFQSEKFGRAFGSKWGSAAIILGDSRFLSAAIRCSTVKFERVAAIVSSPPFLQTTGGTRATGNGEIDSALMKRHAAGNAAVGYGGSAGQIASLPGNDFEQVVSFLRSGGNMDDFSETKPDSGYWLSAARILSRCRLISDEKTRVVWVLKGYVKSGQYIDFPDQWRQLCEVSGFETTHIHRALFERNVRTQIETDGSETTSSETSKSFFRRVVEKKYDLPPIDYESVYCMKTVY